MPSGLADSLLPEERLDLFKFLSMLGKPGLYDAAKGSAARLWRVYTVVSKNQHIGSEPVVRGDAAGFFAVSVQAVDATEKRIGVGFGLG